MIMTYRFSFTAEIVRSLQIIEQSRAEVNLTVLPPAMAESLRLRARVRSTHFSTRIEGNRLTLVEAEQAVLDGRQFPGRDTFQEPALAFDQGMIGRGDEENQESNQASIPWFCRRTARRPSPLRRG